MDTVAGSVFGEGIGGLCGAEAEAKRDVQGGGRRALDADTVYTSVPAAPKGLGRYYISPTDALGAQTPLRRSIDNIGNRLAIPKAEI